VGGKGMKGTKGEQTADRPMWTERAMELKIEVF
jgi:hypothetical protein